MKRLLHLSAILLLAATACQRTPLVNEEPGSKEEPKDGAIHVTIIAGNPAIKTRTELTTESAAIHPLWSKGDRISVIPAVPVDYSIPPVFTSTNLIDEAAGVAEFGGSVAEAGSYVAFYPEFIDGDSDTWNVGWEMDDDDCYYYFHLKPEQRPISASTFDPRYDFLLSDPFEVSASEEDVTVEPSFSRMGAIVRLVFNDQSNPSHASQEVQLAYLAVLGNDAPSLAGVVAYCPSKGSFAVYEGSSKMTVHHEAAPYVMGEGGSYLITYPATLPSGATLRIGGVTNEFFFEKEVTLSRSIELERGKVTTLNVSLSADNWTPVENIEFADQQVKAICLEYFDEDGNGQLSTLEAAHVTTLLVKEPAVNPKSSPTGCTSPFEGTAIQSFDELQYFTGLQSIEEEAFAGCADLTQITLPENVTRLEKSAFAGCGFTTFTVPEQVTQIDEGAFTWCSNLQSFNGKFATDDHKLLICGDVLVAAATSVISGSFTIPEGILTIGENVFDCCTGLTEVTIPEGVQYINKSAFGGCENLEKATLPESIVSIGAEAFVLCPELETINFPSNLYSIGWLAFQGCVSLKSLSLPGSLTEMSDGSFLGCTGLKTVVLGNGMTYVGSRAFEGCTNLRDVTIPASVTIIGYRAFKDCGYLTGISLPNNLEKIGDSAFENTGLSGVTIPSSVTTLGSWAFRYCSNLTTVYIRCTYPPSVGNDTFRLSYSKPYHHADLKIHIPSSENHVVLNRYYNAYGWDVYRSYLVDDL